MFIELLPLFVIFASRTYLLIKSASVYEAWVDKYTKGYMDQFSYGTCAQVPSEDNHYFLEASYLVVNGLLLVYGFMRYVHFTMSLR